MLKEFKRIAMSSDRTVTSYAAVINRTVAVIRLYRISTGPDSKSISEYHAMRWFSLSDRRLGRRIDLG